jgi:hypothetical protein
MQASFHCSRTQQEADLFAEQLKAIVESCSTYGARVGITGACMVTLLNQLRITDANGFMLWEATKFVRLGTTPSKQAAAAMANCIVSKRADLMKWPAGAREYITGDRVIEALEHPSASPYVNCRPAIVAQVVVAMQNARHGTPVEVLQQAVHIVICTLREDAFFDMIAMLQQLHSSPEIKRGLYKVASGRQDVVPHGHAGSLHLETFVRQMSEPDGSGRRLLPPYGMVWYGMGFQMRIFQARGDHGYELSLLGRTQQVTVA